MYRHIIGTQLTRNKQYSWSEKKSESVCWKVFWKPLCLDDNSVSYFFPFSVVRFPKSCSPFDVEAKRRKVFPSRVFTVNHSLFRNWRKLSTNSIKLDVLLLFSWKERLTWAKSGKKLPRIYQYWLDQKKKKNQKTSDEKRQSSSWKM